MRTENGIVVIDAAEIGTAFAGDTSTLAKFVTSVTQALPGATGVVIDTRSSSEIGGHQQYYFGVFVRRVLTAMLDANVVLGSMRYRMHNGYATQTNDGSNSYSSSFVTSAPQILHGEAKTKTPPIAFIVNEHSPSFADMLGGMQAANRAVVIQAGERAPESGGSVYGIELPDNVNVRIRTSELINPDGSVDLQPDAVVANDAALKEAIRAVQENKLSQRPNRTARP